MASVGSSPGTLYLVPSPLGDTGLDSVLPSGVRRIVAGLSHFVVEHPRTARRFLKQVGTEAPLQEIRLYVLDEHTRDAQVGELLQPLVAGHDVGLTSEAGCPGVADPGAKLVALAHASRIRVVPLVGPSAILLALMASGLNGQRFAFHGYLPADQAGRARKVKELERQSARQDQTQIFIETPYRNQALLADLISACDPATLLCLATDISLASESIRTLPVGAWRRQVPDIRRRPTVFLLLARNH